MYQGRLLVGIIVFQTPGNSPCCEGIIDIILVERFKDPWPGQRVAGSTCTRNVYPEPITPAGVKAKAL